MKHAILACSLLVLTGCRLPPDREPVKPLPENGAVYNYGELLSRLYSQANVALDAFFVDGWTELEDASQGIEQTARFLAKAPDPPDRVKTTVLRQSIDLQKEATRLGDAARKKNVESATEAIQRIQLQIRQLKAS